MDATLRFLGAAGTVTGSKYLLAGASGRVLVDCGLFQGYKELRLRNWQPLTSEVGRPDAVLLTHAHIDHSGYLPVLVRDGWDGPVLCSDATADLCEILLPDSGFLQEKDAEYANRHGFSKHHPAVPLYTHRDARRALEQFRPVDFDAEQDLLPDVRFRLRRAGHILGAAIVELDWSGRRIVFSGDLGRYDDPILDAPQAVEAADYLIVESTYGNRRHDNRDPEEVLGETIERTIRRGGTVVIPSFAVGRAQTLLYHLARLKAAGRLAQVPVFLDSPMAVDASELFCRHSDDHRLPEAMCRTACGVAEYVQDVEQSKALNSNRMPKVIISASGMATGGRVLHHLKHVAPDPASTILFAGFQAPGTRGAALVAGAKTIKIHGEHVAVRAEVANLAMLSGHADADEIMRWLGGFRQAPRRTFITHGEPDASDALRQRIETELGWSCQVPQHGEQVLLA